MACRWAIVEMLEHHVWVSRLLLNRRPVASHSKLNDSAGLSAAHTSSTCPLPVKVEGGPRDDTASGHDV